MNPIITIYLRCIVCLSIVTLFTFYTNDVVAQEQHLDSASTQKTFKTKPVLKENQYLIRYGTEEKIITDQLTKDDQLQNILVQKQGVQKEYEEIYNTLVRGVVQQEDVVQNQYKTLLKKPKLEYGVTPEIARKAAFSLSILGYTMETIQKFNEMSGINLFDIFLHFSGEKFHLRTLGASQIIVGKIDSIFFDTSIIDNLDISMLVSVRETLKGDTIIKHLIIRDHGGSHSFRPMLKGTYLLFLSKIDYDLKVLYYHGQPQTNIIKALSSDSDINALPRFSTLRGSIYLAQDNNPIPSPENIAKYKQVYNWCKEYSPIFQNLKIKY